MNAKEAQFVKDPANAHMFPANEDSREVDEDESNQPADVAENPSHQESTENESSEGEPSNAEEEMYRRLVEQRKAKEETWAALRKEKKAKEAQQDQQNKTNVSPADDYTSQFPLLLRNIQGVDNRCGRIQHLLIQHKRKQLETNERCNEDVKKLKEDVAEV